MPGICERTERKGYHMGATDSLVSRSHLEAIGLEPKGQRVYELADGREVTMDITVGQIEFMGEFVGGTILFGEADAEPLLNVIALESVGIEVGPLNQRLKCRPRRVAQERRGTVFRVAFRTCERTEAARPPARTADGAAFVRALTPPPHQRPATCRTCPMPTAVRDPTPANSA